MKKSIITATALCATAFAIGDVVSASDANRIVNLRKIQPWENYFLCSAICSAGKTLGAKIDDYHFYGAFTGDMFAYIYPKKAGNPDNEQCDSGITNYLFDPNAVKRAFTAIGYECEYISSAQIRADFRATMSAIKKSVDKGVPVVAWGMGNVNTKNGNKWNPLPEGCLIGGYVGDTLLVNLYMGPERLPEGYVDSDGYSVITNGLDTTKGLFIADAKIATNDMRKIYSDALNSIPIFLTRPPSENPADAAKYLFGKAAFNAWADTLLNDGFFTKKSDAELEAALWNLHLSPYCCVCTSSADNFLKMVTEQYPDLKIAAELLPLYKKIRDCKDEIWTLSGGFSPSLDKFRTREFRAQVANVLRRMGEVCDEILTIYK